MGKRKRMSRKEIKAKIKVGLAVILSALGITTSVKLIEEAKDRAQTTLENEQETNDFKDTYKVDLENSQEQQYSEKNDIQKAIAQFKSKEDIDALLKDMYIEQHEQVTGDKTLTTEDIEFDFENWQDYVFVNQETGEIVTHGEKPDETKQMLEENYSEKENVNVIYVRSKGKVIDAMSIESIDGENKAVRVVLGDNYNEMKDYTSVLANSNDVNLGEIIVAGAECSKHMGTKDEEYAKFIFSEKVKKAEEKNIENDGYEIDD